MFFIDEYVKRKSLDSPANGKLVLPSTFSIVKLHKKMIETNEIVVSKSTVYQYFRLMYGHVVKAGLKTDYCSYCFDV